MEKKFETIGDLISEPSFLNWFNNQDDRSIRQWEAFRLESEANSMLVNQATQLLRQLEFKADTIEMAQTQAAWERLAAKLPQQRVAPSGKGKLAYLPQRKWWLSAAAVVLIVAGVSVLRFMNRDLKLATQYGQIAETRLPDGSTVLLNANSHLTAGVFREGSTREVWLDGEAFFKIHKTPGHDRFIVHTGKLDIEVTGTQFNVVNRNNHMNVFLKEGSVVLRMGDGTEAHMRPGDYFELKDSRLEKKPVKDQLVLAWQERKLVFENTPLSEVAEKMKEVYGVNVKVDDALLSSKINGVMPNDDLAVLLKAMEVAYNFKIEHVQDTIVIHQDK